MTSTKPPPIIVDGMDDRQVLRQVVVRIDWLSDRVVTQGQCAARHPVVPAKESGLDRVYKLVRIAVGLAVLIGGWFALNDLAIQRARPMPAPVVYTLPAPPQPIVITPSPDGGQPYTDDPKRRYRRRRR